MGNSCSSKEKYSSKEHNATQKPVSITPCAPALHEGSVLSISSFGSDHIVTCSDDKKAAVIDWKRLLKDQLYSPLLLSGHNKAVSCFHCDEAGFAWSASRDLSLKQWNIQTGSCVQTIDNAHSLNITGLTTVSTSEITRSTVFSGSRDYSVKGWDGETGQLKVEYKAPRNIVTTMQVHPVNNNLLYQGSEDLCVRVWDSRQASHHPPAQQLSGYVYFPVSMDLHSDGNLLATGCKGFDSVGCTVKLWDLRNTSKLVAEYAGHSQDVVGCQFSKTSLGNTAEVGPTSPSGAQLLLSASKDGSICMWDYSGAAATSALGSTNTVAPSSSHASLGMTTTGKFLTGLTCLDRSGFEGIDGDGGLLVASSNDGSIVFCRYYYSTTSGISFETILTTTSFFSSGE